MHYVYLIKSISHPSKKYIGYTTNWKQNILGLLAQGMTTQEIMHEYKNLVKEDIFACLAFARDALADATFAPLSF